MATSLMDTWVTQLWKNATHYDKPAADTKGQRHTLFPWTGSFVEPKKCGWQDYWIACSRVDKSAITRCPIFRALGSEQKGEIILRGPKWSLSHNSYHWRLMHRALNLYEKSDVGGVSPLTAMALLLPEPRLERRYGLPDLLVVPQAIGVDHGRRSGPLHRVAEWHVLFWALKRYTTMSWHDAAELSTDLKRTPTSFRQTIRTCVEAPLAAFYRDLTGKDLDPQSYQSALPEGPDSPSWSREKLRELKRAASARRRKATN